MMAMSAIYWAQASFATAMHEVTGELMLTKSLSVDGRLPVGFMNLVIERISTTALAIHSRGAIIADDSTALDVALSVCSCTTVAYLCKQSALRPGRTGIALKTPEWAKLYELIWEMMARSYKLGTADICFHDNPEGQWICTECCPDRIS